VVFRSPELTHATTKEQIVTDPKYAAFTALDPFFDIVQQGLAGLVVPAAEPLCLLLSLRTPTRFGLSTSKHEKGNVGRINRACPGFDRNGQRQRQGLALFRGATAISH
jgi:hypothetical protein